MPTTATLLHLFGTIMIGKPVAGQQALVTAFSAVGTAANVTTSYEVTGNWRNTADLITRIDLVASASSFAADSRFVLEGNRTP